MKIRYLAAGCTAIMFCFLLLTCYFFNHQPENQRDMVYYNEQQVLVEREITKGTPIEEVEREYDCQIILREERDYGIELQNALQEEALILDYMEGENLAGKIIWNENEKHYEEMKEKLFRQTLVLWGIFLLGVYVLLAIFYFCMMRPFQKLEKFSIQVAKGNLDFPLPAEKQNYFGTFTESFDLMREELKRARESEYQANKSKKELIAELSHDIKTPVATIQATCEVMQLKEKNPDTLKKVAVIDQKAKMIHSLVDNLFHATLEELAVLKVDATEESSLEIIKMFSEMNDYGELTIKEKIPEYLIYMDKLRLQQVIDNCLNNAWKYANTPVEVSFFEMENGIRIQIRDQGKGVPEEEIPLISEKFYRGSNAKGKEGSGLGLYLGKMFMEQMKGELICYNENGFVVELFIRKV